MTDISVAVAADTDDSEECLSTGVNTTTSSDLEMVDDSSTCAGNTQKVGIRFISTGIPQGSVIVTAKIQFTARASDSVATSLTLACEDIDAPPTFTNDADNITDRTETSNTVAWNSMRRIVMAMMTSSSASTARLHQNEESSHERQD